MLFFAFKANILMKLNKFVKLNALAGQQTHRVQTPVPVLIYSQ
jgi:hypothetical protein